MRASPLRAAYFDGIASNANARRPSRPEHTASAVDPDPQPGPEMLAEDVDALWCRLGTHHDVTQARPAERLRQLGQGRGDGGLVLAVLGTEVQCLDVPQVRRL